MAESSKHKLILDLYEECSEVDMRICDQLEQYPESTTKEFAWEIGSETEAGAIAYLLCDELSQLSTVLLKRELYRIDGRTLAPLNTTKIGRVAKLALELEAAQEMQDGR